MNHYDDYNNEYEGKCSTCFSNPFDFCLKVFIADDDLVLKIKRIAETNFAMTAFQNSSRQLYTSHGGILPSL